MAEIEEQCVYGLLDVDGAEHPDAPTGTARANR
jgi:hypothetical protein